MIEYNILSTGSGGNAVLINKTILVDAGVPYKALLPHYRNLKLILLTHIHGDHFNKSTIKRLANERPTLRFGCGEWLAGDLVSCGVRKQNIDLYQMTAKYQYDEFSIHPFKLIHNVQNCGYRIFYGADSLLYATDTNSMNGIEAKGFDIYLLEANYTEKEIVQRIKEKQDNGAHPYEWDVLKNHLSKEKADAWLYSQMGANSQYIYLHGHGSEAGWKQKPL